MADSAPHGAKHLPLDISISCPEYDASTGTNLVAPTAELMDFEDNGGLVTVSPSDNGDDISCFRLF